MSYRYPPQRPKTCGAVQQGSQWQQAKAVAAAPPDIGAGNGGAGDAFPGRW